MATQLAERDCRELSTFYAENGYAIIRERADARARSRRSGARRPRSAAASVGAVMGVKPPARRRDRRRGHRALPLHPPPAQDLGRDAALHARTRRSSSVLTSVIGPNVKCMQSMLFIKAAGQARPGLAPGRELHPDARPLADRRVDRAGRCDDRERLPVGDPRLAQGTASSGRRATTDDERFDCADEAFGFPYTDDDAVPVEVTAGAARVLQRLPAAPLAAEHDDERLPPRARQPLHERRVAAAWNYAREDFRDVVLVAGRDPYAYKGVERLASPQVRPEGVSLGGCAWVEEAEIAAAIEAAAAKE